MKRHGKKYVAAAKLLEPGKAYSPQEAVELAKKTSYVSFDATVEMHLKMGVDPRHADQQVRSVALLPKGLGKQVRVLVFAQGEGETLASQAGADFVGTDDLIKRIEEGWFDFDVAIATPDLMGKVGRLGRHLGRRGLMPNPKSGTIVQAQDLPRAIREARLGRVEFRLDRTAIIHVPIGKVSFESAALLENLLAMVEAVQKAKPTGARGQFFRSIYVTTAMGPGIKLDLASAITEAA